MRHIVNTKDGGPEVLKVQEVDDPVPAPDELRVRVDAAGINFADILARKGIYPDAPPKPCVVGYEVAGVVDQVGTEIDQQWVDQPVIAFCRFQGQAEYVTVKEQQIFPKPESLTFAQAATLPVNYLTAWVLIHVMGSLTGDETILIHNAGGGVGLAALDIALQTGAQTIGTASQRKHSFLVDRGLHHAIDYRKSDWLPRVMEITKNRGVDLILDPLGGKHWKKSREALRSTGRLGMFGISSASERAGMFSKLKLLKTVISMPFYHPLSLLDQNHGVFGVNLGHLWHEPEKSRIWFKQLINGVEEGWIQPHVDKTFSFDDVAKAHAYIENRKNIGKVILTP
ncbi:MAG: zinc-binding dehydrogenase [Bacteroidota bacterium]